MTFLNVTQILQNGYTKPKIYPLISLIFKPSIQSLPLNMKSRWYLTIAALILIASCSPQQDSLEKLRSDVDSIMSSSQGRFAVVFEEYGNPDNRLGINEQMVFHAASTMKTPVMAELWRQASMGERSLDDSILVRNTFFSIVDGSPYEMDISRDGGDDLYKAIGEKRTIRALTFDMITVSSNLATNILIEEADAKRVTEFMRSLGADSIQVLRGVEDMKAYDAGLNNRATAQDLAILFRYLLDRGAAADDMVAILKAQKFKDMIGAGVPSGVEVASKSGSITNTAHDSGIVYLPDGRKYILVILSDQLASNDDGIKAGSEISRRIYEHMVQH
jgi:beta-lactamase class A